MSKTTVKFKKAGINDLYTIKEIAYATWPVTFGRIIPIRQIVYMLNKIYNDNSLKEQILEKGHNFIMAKKDNKPVGFTSYELNYNSEPQLMIHKLYLLPGSQGSGIGTQFLNLLAQIAQQNNHKRLRLKVYYQNDIAIRFYEKYGFIIAGRETTDTGNNYIILDNVMVKDLQ